MLVPFTLSPGCLEPLGSDLPSARARVTELRNLWKRAGVLVVDTDDRLVGDYRRRLASEHLPGWLRRLWQDVIMELKERVLPVQGWIGPHECEYCEPQEILPAESLLIHLNERNAWGLGESNGSTIVGDRVEVCRLDCLPDSRFAGAVEQSGRMFRKKTPTAEVLARFRLICSITTSIVIVDPYFGKEEVVKPGRSGGRRFIEHLAGIRESIRRPLTSLVVYTAKDVPRSMTDSTIVSREDILLAWEPVRAAVSSSAVGEFRLRLVDSRRFGLESHDRFGRFGDFAVQIGAGFVAFEGQRLMKRTSILPAAAESVREIEDALRVEASYEEVLL